MTYPGSLPSGQAFNGQQHLPQAYHDPYANDDGNGNGNGSVSSQNPPYQSAAYDSFGQAQGNFHPSPVLASASASASSSVSGVPPAPAPMNMHANGHGHYPPAYGGNFPQQQQQQQQAPLHYPHQSQQAFAHGNVMNSPFVSPHVPHAFPQNTQAVRSPAPASAPAPNPTTPTYAEYQPQLPQLPQQQAQYQQHFQQPVHQLPRHQVQQQQQQNVQTPQLAPQLPQFSQPAMGHNQSVPLLNQTFAEPSHVQPSPRASF